MIPLFHANILTDAVHDHHGSAIVVPTPADYRGSGMMVMPWTRLHHDDIGRTATVETDLGRWLVVHPHGTLPLLCPTQQLARQAADLLAQHISAGDVMADSQYEINRWCQRWIDHHPGVRPISGWTGSWPSPDE